MKTMRRFIHARSPLRSSPARCGFSVLLAIGFLSISLPCFGAELPIRGVVLFTRPPATYPEVANFSSLTKANIEFSRLVQPNGGTSEIANSGIIAVLEYPPAQSDSKSQARAAAVVSQIEAALAKYPRGQFPEIHSKLGPLAARWRTFRQTAAVTAPPRNVVPAPVVSPPVTKLTITTTDGQQFDNVTVSRVDDDSISFKHEAGAATLDLSALPPLLQQQFHYDPKKADLSRATKRAALEKEKQFNASLRPAVEVGGGGTANGPGSGIRSAEEFRQQWLRDAQSAGTPPALNSQVGPPDYETTVEYLNSRLRIVDRVTTQMEKTQEEKNHQLRREAAFKRRTLWFSGTHRRMALLLEDDTVCLFDPGDLNPILTLRPYMSWYTSFGISVNRATTRHGQYPVLVYSPKWDKPREASGMDIMTPLLGEDADKFATAWSHLIRLMSERGDPF